MDDETSKREKETSGQQANGAPEHAPSQDASRNETGSAPEPPVRWNQGHAARPDPDSATWKQSPGETPGSPNAPSTAMGAIGSTRFRMSASEAAEFQSARRYISISQITAIISLFFGGILLSSVAVVCAFIARGKLDNIAAARTGEPDVQQALKRSGLIVVAVAALALVLNIAAVIYLYPFVMDAMQSGDLASLVGGSASSAAGAGSSTWG